MIPTVIVILGPDPTLDESSPATADYNDESGVPSVENDDTYQVGTTADYRIITSSGSNTVTFDWDSDTDQAAANGTYCVRLTVNNGSNDQVVKPTQTFTIDNVDPANLASFAAPSNSGADVTLTWTAATDTNFNHYEIWWGSNQSDVQNRTGTATEFDNDDDVDLATATTATTVVTANGTGTDYFKIWAVDDYGNVQTVSDVSYVYNAAPTGSFNSALQKTDGTSYVDISIEVDDGDNDNSKVKIEFDTDGNCNGAWNDATILGPTTASVGSDPDVDNGPAYQVGNNTVITTTGSNTVTFDWDSSNAADAPTGNGTYCLRLTANDGTTDQSPEATQTLTIDNVVPSVDTGLAITNPADYNDGDDWYDQGKSEGENDQMSFTTGITDDNLNSCSWIWDHSDGTSYDYNNSDVEIGTDADLTAAEMDDPGGIDLSDDPDGTISLAVGCSDSYGNSATSTITFKFDNTDPTTPGSFDVAADGTTAVDVTWTEVTETNFNHYEIWYGENQSDVENRSDSGSGGTAIEFDDGNQGNLATRTTQQADISGLDNSATYYFRMWAIDNVGNVSNTATTQFDFSVCGDGVVESLEECDPIGSTTSCGNVGNYDLGTAVCDASCKWDEDLCDNTTPGGGCTSNCDDPLSLTISSVDEENIQASSADISWSTNIDSDSYVIYDTSPFFSSQVTVYDNALTQSHLVPLSSLEASTLYYYRVRSVTAANESETSSVYNFSTTECNNGDQQLCGVSEVGECSYGQETCLSGEWEECTAVFPSNDICDGLDNDCDVTTVDGSNEYWFDTSCDGPDGDLCTEGVYICTNGSQLCTDTTETTVEICTGGLDEDCDGDIDADDPDCAGSSYYCDIDSDKYINEQISGSCLGANCVPAGCQTTQGTDCNDGNALINPGITEDCQNGYDDDCDTLVDENDPDCKCTPGQQQDCGPNTNEGECNIGTMTCQPNGILGSCEDEVYRSAEDCNNGLDDDCDGDTDIFDQDCCISDWSCEDWTDCVDDIKYRTCFDTKYCDIPQNRPSTQQSCQECVPDWECDWGECNADVEALECVDLNNCDRPDLEPVQYQACGQECTITCPTCYTPDFDECACVQQSSCCGNSICEENESYQSCDIDCSKLSQCQDGIDNDDDGKIDYPNDSGCESESDNSEGSIKETIIIIGELSENLSENLIEVTQNLSILTIKSFQQNIINPLTQFADNVQVEDTTKKIVAPAIIAVAGTSAASAIGFANFLAYLQYIVTQPFYLLTRRRRKKWGTVYNSITKQPIDLAIVRVFDGRTRRLIRSRVTDKQGRYSLMVPPGYYYLTITKPQYTFPSQVLKGKKQDIKYLDIYHGEIIDVVDKNVLITGNIPVDPQTKMETPREIIRKTRIMKLQKVFAFSSLPLSFLPVLIIPSITTASLFGIQVLLFFLFKKLAVAAKPKGWGIVYDKGNKAPVEKTIMRIFDKTYNKLLESQITDSKGRYSFLTSGENYYITAEKEGYQRFQSEFKGEPKPEEQEELKEKKQEEAHVVSMDIGLKKEINNISK